MRLLSASVVRPIIYPFSFFAIHTNRLLPKSVESFRRMGMMKMNYYCDDPCKIQYKMKCMQTRKCFHFLPAAISTTHSNSFFWMCQTIADFQIGRKMHCLPNSNVHWQYIILHDVGCLSSKQLQISRSTIYRYVTVFQIRTEK